MRWKELILGLAVCLSLSGCLTTNEVISTGAAAGTALVASAAGAPAVLVATTSAAAGITAGVVTEEPEPTVDITQVETPEQAEVAKSQIFWDALQAFWMWAVGALVVLIVAAWLIPGPQFMFRRKRDEG